MEREFAAHGSNAVGTTYFALAHWGCAVGVKGEMSTRAAGEGGGLGGQMAFTLPPNGSPRGLWGITSDGRWTEG